MKANLFLLLLCCLVACKEQKATDQPVSAATPEPAKTETVQKPATSDPAPAKDPNAPVHVKASNTAFLIGMWEYTFALGGTNETPKYKGRWIKFNGDDTFTSGRYNKETNRGTYSFEREPKIMLTLAYDQKEEIPRQWEVQGQGHESGMVFKGNTPLNPAGTQVKMQQITERPKKQ